MKNLKKITILHSNDMHGDFVAEKVNDKLVGGVSMLSGYIQRVRKEEKNVIYAIAGDMLQGSLVDAEYKGISTIQMMNMLAPNVATVGNHEVDYGVAHLLFLEKCASFPIVNANMYLKTNHKRLFDSHVILEIDGMKIMFIGIVTEQVLSMTKKDRLLGTLIDVDEAAREIGVICDSYQTVDIDFTVVLTHIGLEDDRKLAALLDPRWGVDLIVGGHSHTFMDKPEIVNGIPIAHAGAGTDQIGRFDIMVDTDLNSIDSFTWSLVPINEETCERDLQMEEVFNTYNEETESKYARVITRFADKYVHPMRRMETSLGTLFADVIMENMGLDIMLLASGSVRGKELGPIVTLKDFVECFPYRDVLHQFKVSGAQFKTMMRYMLREEGFVPDAHTEFYQLSRGLEVIYDRKIQDFVSVKFHGKDMLDDDVFTMALQDFHYLSMKEFFDVSIPEVSENGQPKILSTSTRDTLLELLSRKEMFKVDDTKRLTILE